MKRIIFSILWAFISMYAFSYENSADFYVDNIGYTVLTFTGDLTCEVSDGTYCKGNITIPEYVTHQGRTLKVVEIAAFAFEKSDVTSIVVPETIEKLGAYCFTDCKALKSIKLPNYCCDIGYGAFRNCI